MIDSRRKGIQAREQRIGSGRQRPAAAAAGALAVLSLAVLAPAAAASELAPEGALGRHRWVSLGVVSGWVKPDSKLADYQWDTSPRWTLGGEALGGLGRVALGLRLLRSETTQTLGAFAAPGEASVRSTTWELVGRVRLASLGRMDVLATAGGGLLHMGYAPDRIQVDAGTGALIAVELEPIDEWTASAGLAVERALAGRWVAGLGVEHRVFSMDTAHRSGAEIVSATESFHGWSARLGLAWRYGI